MVFGLLSRTFSVLEVREIVFTQVLRSLGYFIVEGLAEIRVRGRFHPWDFTLNCNRAETTTDEVKQTLETLQRPHVFEDVGVLGSGTDMSCRTTIGTMVIQRSCRGSTWRYGAPHEWRRHPETFWYCNKNTRPEDIVRKTIPEGKDIRFCSPWRPSPQAAHA